MSTVHRRAALRVCSAYRTVSTDAAGVVAGVIPFNLMAEERRRLFLRGRLLDQEAAGREERVATMAAWQRRWEMSTKGRWTNRLIPNLDVWLNRPGGEVNFWLTQLLTGHGCFRAYLFRFRRETTPLCPVCEEDEDVFHVFFMCHRFSSERDTLCRVLRCDAELTPERLGEALIGGEERWNAISLFSRQVLRRLQEEERARRIAGPLV